MAERKKFPSSQSIALSDSRLPSPAPTYEPPVKLDLQPASELTDTPTPADVGRPWFATEGARRG